MLTKTVLMWCLSGSRLTTCTCVCSLVQGAESKAAQHLSDDAKSMDKLLAQRVIFATKRDDCNKKIRELGALPREAYEKFASLSMKQLMSKLEKTNADLKKVRSALRRSVLTTSFGLSCSAQLRVCYGSV